MHDYLSTFSPGYTVGMLEQEPALDKSKTVREVVEEGVQEIVDLLKAFEDVNNQFADPAVMDDPDAMDKLISKQGEIQEKT